MATPIHCDADGCGQLYDVILTTAEPAQTTSWCYPHFLDMARSLVQGADAAEIEATDAAAEAALASAGPAADPTASPGSSAVDDQPPGPPTSAGDGPRQPEPHQEATPTRRGRQRPSDGPTGDVEAGPT